METRLIPTSAQGRSPGKPEQLQLLPGDTLRAKVIALSDDGLTLRVGQRQLQAKLTAPNAHLQHAFERQGSVETSFRVIRNKPNLVLKIGVEAFAEAVPRETKFARTTVPYQQPLVEVFKYLSTSKALNIDPKMPRHPDAVPHDLAKLTAEINNRLPTLTSLISAAGFKSALTQSGVLFESQLADWLMKNSARPSADLKARLFEATAALSTRRQASFQNPGLQAQLRTLSSQIDAALARIETLQLASSQASDHDKNLLFFEIPYKQDATVNAIRGFVEQRNQAPSDDAIAGVSIGLEIRLSERDILLAKVKQDALGLHVILWSESTHIQQAIQAGRATFEQNLGKHQASAVRVELQRMAPDVFEPLQQFDGLLFDEV